MQCIRGFSLVELLVAIAIVAVVASIAFPSYAAYKDRADVAVAISDINTISQALERYWVQEGGYPDSLADLGLSMTDPWGKAYYYKKIAGVRGVGGLRKDKSLVPINSDYDLYSAGKDGATVNALTAATSHDDVIRAGNGAFVGLAEDY